MTKTRAPLLLTRPERQSRRFAEDFRARFGRDWPVLIAPLMRIEWLRPEMPPDMGGGIIFTSENAVSGYARLTKRRDGVAWCVGERTEAAARGKGFRTRTGPGDAEGLAAAILREGPGQALLWPRAVHVARDLARELSSAGIDTQSMVVYDQIPCALSADATRILGSGEPVLLPIFSPRSARLAVSALADLDATLLVAAISRAVADAAKELSPLRLVVAARPDGPAMLDALDELVAPDMTG